tara:strand:+ start:3238 stop:10071 length:6834 start_codon:yes stop_codon:yes gene_type:complete
MQKTDLNVSPYYDDFDPNDKFHRVLFRPGFAVQARELTTLQSILQNQVEKHGRHFFKEGAMVIPGQISFDIRYYAVKLQTSIGGNNIAGYLADYVDGIITGDTSGVTARVVGYSDATTTDEPTLYVKYISTATATVSAAGTIGASTAGLTNRFVVGESISVDKAINSGTIVSGALSAILLTSNAIETGSAAAIEEGVYFIRGQFVKVDAQRIILDKYSNTPSYRIGLAISETLITPEADNTLLDNATGSSNVNAKGGHRLKFSLTLSKLPLGSADDEEFVELMRVKNGSIQKIVDRTDYNIFQENIARRTFDESGNYSVRPYAIEIKETLDDGSNNGVYASNQVTDGGNTAAEASLTIQVSPGKAYVRGYEIDHVVPSFIDLPKPRTTENFDSAITNVEVGNFTRVTNVKGTPDLSPFISGDVAEPYREIQLHSVQKTNYSTAANAQIGVARARAFEHSSGNTSNDTLSNSSDNDAEFNLYLFDIRMFTQIQLSANFGGSPNGVAQGSKITGQTSGATGFVHSAVNNLVQLITVSGNFNVGEKLISSAQTTSNNANQLIEDASNNELTVAVITSRNFDDVKSVFMNSPNTGQDFTANLVLSSNLTLGGTVSINHSSASTTINGFNTTFTLDLKVGDFVTVPGAGSGGADLTTRVTAVTNNTTLTIATGASTTVTSVPIVRNRNQLRDQEKNLLLRKLRKDTIKTLKTDTNDGVSQTVQTFRRTFVVTTTAAGEINLTAGSNETFSAKSNTDCVVTIITAGSAIGGSSNTAAAGDIINLDASTTPAQTYVVSGNQLTITNPEILGNGAKVKVIATLTRTVAAEKTKTKQPAHLVLVDADSSAGPAYGTASQHKEISLGRADVYKIYAVLDSEDTSTTPKLPEFTVTSVSGTFQKGETIQGASSGANAVIVNTTNPITFITTNGKSLIANETITGVTSTATATTGTFTAGSKDITSRFTLDTGQRDNFYDISRLVRKGGKPTPIGKLLIVCDYFAHGTGDFFSVDSYGAIDYKEIPTYTATRVDPEVKTPSGEFDLRDTVDFRPRVADATIDTTTTSQSQTLHKVTSKSFDFSSRTFAGTGASEILIPKDNSQFQYDFDFFLGRVDMLFLTEYGTFKIVEGEPAENPFIGKRIEKAMLLATIQLPPYVLDIDDTSFEKTDNRRFTMRDIGSIERRLNQVEYYTALNLLEKDAQSFQVQDENGLDRFKSGFVVDNFSGHSVGDVQNADYRNAIDYENNELRPKFTMKGISLIEENTTDTQRTADNYQKTGDIITLPYSDVVSVQQPYATRVENLNPVLSFSWTGICSLDPSGDEWFEVNRLPALIINRDGNFDQLVAQVGNAMGTIWNSWQTQWTGTSQSERVISTSGAFQEGNALFSNVVTRVTTTTTRRQRRDGINTRVIAQIDRESLGDRLRSTALIPFMRSKNVNFVVDGLKPNTRMYPFFDKVDVSRFVTPATGGVGTVTSINGAIFSDGGGSCTGLFTIPDPNVAGNPQFQTGERLFRLTSSSTNATNPEPETFAQALFSSTGILRNIQEEILATRNGRIEVQNVNDTRIISNETSTNRVDRNFLNLIREDDDDNENEDGSRDPGSNNFSGWDDPLAQTILSSETGGEFVTKIDVFFQRKDPDIPVLCQIREVVNGFPTRKQLPFAQRWLQPYMKGTVEMSNGGTTVTGTNTDFLTGAHNLKVGDTITIQGLGNQTSGVTNDTGNYDATALVAKVTAIASDTSLTVDTAAARGDSGKKISNVNLSSTAATPTTFRFDSPVYLQENQEVCIVLFTPCERYFAWISRMGEQEINGTRMISKQPHLGVLFKSQNNSTWTAYDYEDLKFTVHRASFDIEGGRGTLTLTNDVVESKTLGADPIRTISGSSFVQVSHPDHHMYSASNNVTVSGVTSGITTTLGAAISSTTQTAITITANSDFVADSGGSNITIKIGDEIIQGAKTNATTITASTRGYDSTTAATHANGATVELYQINGIPLDQVNKTHPALANIGIDSYTVVTSNSANASSNQGGSAVVVTENAMMDGMQTLLPTILYPETGINSTIRTTTATSPNGTETSFSLAGTTFAKPITLGENFIFDKPRMVASQINETNEIAGQKSFYLDLELRSSRENLSPVVDLDRKSIVAFSNRLNKIDSASDMGVTALHGDYVSSEQPQGDVNEAIYMTRRVALDTPATGIKVFLDMNRFASANVKVMFKILRSDDASDFDEIGYNFFNTDGSPDSVVNASLSATDFKEYEYTANNLDEFIAFSIKIVMQGTNSSEPPRLKDLRALALAT